MSIAVDTNVLVRVLVQDATAPGQCAAARRLVERAVEAGEPLLVTLCVLLETEWVLRSRYRLARPDIAAAFVAMLETAGIEFEHEPTVEEALDLVARHPSADFADCLLVAHAVQLGRSRLLTFDAAAARLPGAELLVAA